MEEACKWQVSNIPVLTTKIEPMLVKLRKQRKGTINKINIMLAHP